MKKILSFIFFISCLFSGAAWAGGASFRWNTVCEEESVMLTDDHHTGIIGNITVNNIGGQYNQIFVGGKVLLCEEKTPSTCGSGDVVAFDGGFIIGNPNTKQMLTGAFNYEYSGTTYNTQAILICVPPKAKGYTGYWKDAWSDDVNQRTVPTCTSVDTNKTEFFKIDDVHTLYCLGEIKKVDDRKFDDTILFPGVRYCTHVCYEETRQVQSQSTGNIGPKSGGEADLVADPVVDKQSANGADPNANSDLLAQEKGTTTQVQDGTDPAADPAADKQQAETDKKYSGYVYGKTDDGVIGLFGARVRSDTDPSKDCLTDDNGFFNDCVLPSNKVIVSYEGYSKKNVELNENNNEIMLEPIVAAKDKDPNANANQDPSPDATACTTAGGTFAGGKCTCKTGRYWNEKQKQCFKICDHLLNDGTIDGMENIASEQLEKRKVCCKIPENLAKWKGDLAKGSCKCTTDGASLDNGCKVDQPPADPNANGGAVVNPDPATGDGQALSLCTKAGGHLDENTCVCGEKQNATYNNGQCVCTNEVEDWDITNKKCVVNDKKKQEQACTALGSKANWEHEKCVCTNDTEDYKYDASTGTGSCVENQERKNKKDCEKLGTRVAKWENNECICIDESNRYNPETKKCEIDEEKAKAKRLSDKQDAYDAAKETEQSLENRMLGGLTTAATGLGGMQLAQGLSEKKADKAAEADMAAYMATFRCTYGNGKSVKGGATPIELPGGNDTEMMQLRNEYFALAQSLKERKESLGMKPGIESEEILDKTQMGLYDAENTGISGGNYASLYRAQMGNTNDQEKIDTDKEKSDKRVKIGGTVAAVGVAGGILGNSIINGKLGDMIKDNKTKKAKSREEKAIIEKLKSGLSGTGMINVNKLDFSKVDLTGLKIDEIDFTKIRGDYDGKDATKIINTSNASSFSSSFEKLFR